MKIKHPFISFPDRTDDKLPVCDPSVLLRVRVRVTMPLNPMYASGVMAHTKEKAALMVSVNNVI